MTAADLPHVDLPRAPGPRWTGAALLILGMIALVFPFVTTIGVTYLVGALLMVSGAVMFVQAFHCHPAWRLALHLVWGFFQVAAGIGMLILPVTGALTISLLLAAMFLMTGATRIALALHRPRPHRWALGLVSGLISIALAVLVITTLPLAMFWLPGIVVGVDLVFAGVALVAMRDVRALGLPVGAPKLG